MIDAAEIVLSMVYFLTLFYTVFLLVAFLEDTPEKKRNLSSKPIVSVIIPAYNEEGVIRETMNSALNLDYPPEKLELIVVNDGSTDETRKIVEDVISENKSKRIILVNQKNKGKYSALNVGIKIAKGEFFACLDADSIVENNALKKMLPYFENKKTAVVLPLMKIRNPKNIWQKIQHYEYVINMFYKKIMSNLNCVHVAPGPFSIYRTKTAIKEGGFRKGHNTEDLEITLRLQKKNYKIVQLMNVEVLTDSPDNFRNLYRKRNRWNMGSVLNAWDYRKMIFNKKYGDFGLFQMPFVLFAGFFSLTIIILTLALNIIKPLAKALHNLSLVNYDIMTYVRNYRFELNLLDFDYYKIIIFVSVLTISLADFIASHKYCREKLAKHGIIPLFVFMFFYYLLLGIIWLGIVKDLLFKRKTEW